MGRFTFWRWCLILLPLLLLALLPAGCGSKQKEPPISTEATDGESPPPLDAAGQPGAAKPASADEQKRMKLEERRAAQRQPGAGRPRVGADCRYRSVMGKARIDAVEPTRETTYGNRQAWRVVFTFTPDVSTEETRQRVSLTVGDGKSPAKECLDEQGVVPGSTHRCIRRVLVAGSCSPEVYKFPDFDEKRCL